MDLFGNTPRSPTAKLENDLIARALPRARDAGRDPRKRRAPDVTPDAPAFIGPLDLRMVSRFRDGKAEGTRELHRKKSRALPMSVIAENQGEPTDGRPGLLDYAIADWARGVRG